VREDDRVVIGVHDPRLRRDRLRDLVGVARCRNAGADVQELAYPRLSGEVADGATEERPVRARGEEHLRVDLQPRLDGGPVGREVVFAAQSQKDRLEHAVWEAGKASEILSEALGNQISVRPALAIYGPRVPWDIATIRGVDVFTGRTLRKCLRRRGRELDAVPKLTREEVRTIYETAAGMLPDAARG